jgi:hypothetical protein
VVCRAQEATAEVEEIARQYDASLFKNDAAFLDKVFDDEGTFIDEQGKVYGKKQWRTVLDEFTFETGKSLDRSFRSVAESMIEVGIWEKSLTSILPSSTY